MCLANCVNVYTADFIPHTSAGILLSLNKCLLTYFGCILTQNICSTFLFLSCEIICNNVESKSKSVDIINYNWSFLNQWNNFWPAEAKAYNNPCPHHLFILSLLTCDDYPVRVWTNFRKISHYSESENAHSTEILQKSLLNIVETSAKIRWQLSPGSRGTSSSGTAAGGTRASLTRSRGSGRRWPPTSPGPAST